MMMFHRSLAVIRSGKKAEDPNTLVINEWDIQD
jgi:hypothetical protein